jgi:hypothetical protein
MNGVSNFMKKKISSFIVLFNEMLHNIYIFIQKK